MPTLHPTQLPTHPRRLAAAGSAALACGLALGVVLRHEGPVRTGELRLDERIGTDHEAALTCVARVIDVALSPPGAIAIAVALALVVALRNRWSALALLVATAGGWLSVGAGKVLFARHRPPTGLVHALVVETGSDSFPSGHTAFAAALVGGVALALRVSGRSTLWAWVVGVPFVAVVAASRLYLGAHYLGDVVASNLFAGGTIALGTSLVALVVRSRGAAA